MTHNHDASGRQTWPDPSSEMLNDPRFNAVWSVIKTWDVAVPSQYSGYCGATGNHVRAIIDALPAAPAAGEAVAVDEIDISGWAAWKGHALPIEIARHIAAKVNEVRAAPSLKDQFERVISSLQYQGGVNGDENSLTVGEIRSALP